MQGSEDWGVGIDLHRVKIEREGDAAKVCSRKGQPWPRYEMLDCEVSAMVTVVVRMRLAYSTG